MWKPSLAVALLAVALNGVAQAKPAVGELPLSSATNGATDQGSNGVAQAADAGTSQSAAPGDSGNAGTSQSAEPADSGNAGGTPQSTAQRSTGKAGGSTTSSATAKFNSDPPPVPSAWATRGELGFVMARGNTDTESGNLKFDTAHVIGRWKYSLGGSALYGTSNGIRTAQRWDAHFQTDVRLDERAYWFGAVRYEDDLFSGFAYQESFSSGAGYDFIKTPSTKLSAQMGAGVRRLRPELLVRDSAGAVIQRIPGYGTSDAVGNGAMTFEHAFNRSTKLLDAFLIESGQHNTMTKNNLSLQVKMNSTLALAIGYQLFRNSQPPAGAIKRTDTVTTVNLVYELKNPAITPTAGLLRPNSTASATTAQAK